MKLKKNFRFKGIVTVIREITPKQEKWVTGYIFTLACGAISQVALRQTIVVMSTAEAEYVAGAEAAMEEMGLQNILIEALQNVKVHVNTALDNQAAIVLSTDTNYSRRTRHIEMK